MKAGDGGETCRNTGEGAQGLWHPKSLLAFRTESLVLSTPAPLPTCLLLPILLKALHDHVLLSNLSSYGHSFLNE